MAVRTVSPYREAQIAARRVVGQIEPALAQAIQDAIDGYVSILEQRLSSAPTGSGARASLRQSIGVLRRQSSLLERALLNRVDGATALTRQQTTEIWSRAFEAASGGSLGLRAAPINMIGAYTNVGGAKNWATLVRRNWDEAVVSADAIFVEGMTQGMGANELARRLRRYVDGSEQFDKLFVDDRIDLRRLTKDQREAARRMVTNSRRIAITELHNARREAEVQFFLDDPLTEAVRWVLAPNRGNMIPPDECDVLATTDFYGMGPGVYPVTAVPMPPHPYDRCDLLPVTRDVSEFGKPKPSPDRQKPKFDSSVFRGLSRDRADAIKDRALSSVEHGRVRIQSASTTGVPPAPDVQAPEPVASTAEFEEMKRLVAWTDEYAMRPIVREASTSPTRKAQLMQDLMDGGMTQKQAEDFFDYMLHGESGERGLTEWAKKRGLLKPPAPKVAPASATEPDYAMQVKGELLDDWVSWRGPDGDIDATLGRKILADLEVTWARVERVEKRIMDVYNRLDDELNAIYQEMNALAAKHSVGFMSSQTALELYQSGRITTDEYSAIVAKLTREARITERLAVLQDRAESIKNRAIRDMRRKVAPPPERHGELDFNLIGDMEGFDETGVALNGFIDKRWLPQYSSVHVQPKRNGRASYDAATLKVDPVPGATQVHDSIHEVGHFLDDVYEEIGIAGKAFLDARVGKDPTIMTRSGVEVQKFEEGMLRTGEYFRPDTFRELYTGRIYAEDWSVTEDWQYTPTEITSTGLQYMWENPVEFARRDFGHWLYTIRLMNGQLPYTAGAKAHW